MRKFDNVLLAREKSRDVWGWLWLEQLWQDVSFSLRMLRKSPGFTIIAVFTIALGIDANTFVFALINALLLRTLPVPNPQKLARSGRSSQHFLPYVCTGT